MSYPAIWLLLGLALIAVEFVAASFVLVFPGLAALLIAPLVWLGLLADPMMQIGAWLVLSVVLTVLLRGWLRNRLGGGETEVGEIDEDVAAFAETAEVVAAIPAGGEGRIRFNGTTWPATCVERDVPEGTTVRVLYRDNLTWVVIPEEVVDAVVDA